MKTKTFIRFLGLCFFVTYFIVFSWTFLTAYNHESKTVLVDINYYGEAHIELILLLFSFIICGWAIKLFMDDVINTEVKNKLEELEIE